MAKNQFQLPARTENKPNNGSLKKKNKFAAKLKSKLKSAIFNQKDTASESLIADAKTPKSNIKFNHPIASTSKNNKPQANPNASHPNKVGKNSKPINQNPKMANESDNQNKNKQTFSSKQKNKNNSQASSGKTINLPGKPNGLQNAVDSSKKKKNKRKQKKTLSNSTTPTLEKQQKPENSKHKVGEATTINKDGGKKRLKVVGGFVESNADDEGQTKLVNEKLKKTKKRKFAKKSKPEGNVDHAQAEAEAAASIKVHNVVEGKMNGSGENSDSEADSYIDKFFHNNDGDFDENRIYSLDEIDAQKQNGFLVQDSGEELTESDETSSSEQHSPVNKKTQAKRHSMIAPNDAKSLPHSSDTKLVSYKKMSGENEYDFDEYDWPISGEEDDDDSIQYDSNDLMYGSDSEISLGSEVMDSDDLDDTYECESSDSESIESIDEYEDDDDDYDYSSISELDDSDGSEYSDSESGNSSYSNDTYDNFLHSRHNDDDHNSNDDHEYASKFANYSICNWKIQHFSGPSSKQIITNGRHFVLTFY